jgi:hypothetical protein
MSNQEQSRAISIRVKHIHRSKYKNQRRHDLRIGRQPSYVDSDRSEQNRVLVEMPMPVVMNARAKTLRDRTNPTRAMRDNAAIATIGVITFGKAAQPIMDALTPEQQDAAFLEVAQRIADECGTSLRSLVIHVDETALHAHVAWDARDENGVPMSRIMKGSRLQDIAAEVIDKHAPGIVRGVRKTVRQERGDDPSKIYNRSVKELHDDLPREIEEKKVQLAELLERVDEMQLRVQSLEEREELNAKEEKRLQTYRNRLAARVTEYNSARELLENRTSTIEERELALDVRAQAQDIRERALDAAELEMDREEVALDAREAEVQRLSERLQATLRAVQGMIGDAADRLGVGATLRAIRDRLSRDLDLHDHGPAPE